MYIPRQLSAKLLDLSKKFPVVTLTGPRQSGKTTLTRHTFPQKFYVNLEDPEKREFALTDPRGFLEQFQEGAILDEVQRVPHLFSYIQVIVDEKQKKGMYILTGSQQFGLLENITQSLAGRAAILDLLPFSYEELKGHRFSPDTIEALLFMGAYPRLYDHKIESHDWFSSYIRTYVERDVRLIKNIEDLSSFQRFTKMCAARTGQILNLSSLGNDCGITHNTAKSWFSVLEASYLVFRLQPHYKNFNKRLVKSPKLYFWDTGLACYLLGVEKYTDLVSHSKRGDLFENWVITEMMKQYYHQGKKPPLFFWQDQRGREIDVLIEMGEELIPVEIKSGKTIVVDYFKNLQYWCQLAGKEPKKSILIYAGDENQNRKQGRVLSWRSVDQV